MRRIYALRSRRGHPQRIRRPSPPAGGRTLPVRAEARPAYAHWAVFLVGAIVVAWLALAFVGS